ncbi:MAG: hypothetical protein P5681_26945, partial [Limnospira sp. PMC 894.15]|uniref:hypothetical protein n=1 Tax=Limnospira sp. PMC 894.15 TaxID=2981100 RepID=UPI0028E0D43B
ERRSLVSGNFEKPGFFKKRGRVYIAAGEEEYRLLNPPLQEYVTPGWLGKGDRLFLETSRNPVFSKNG